MEKLPFSQLNDAEKLFGSDVIDGLQNYFKGNLLTGKLLSVC